MKFGIIKETKEMADGSEDSTMSMMHESEITSTYRQYKVRHIIHDAQQETALYLKFSLDTKAKLEAGTLKQVFSDPDTMPRFVIDYSTVKPDGSYVVYTSWTERV